MDRIHRLRPGELERYWRTGNAPKYAISTHDVADLERAEWLVALEMDEGTVLARVAHMDLQAVLHMRVQLALLGSPIPELPTLVRIRGPQYFADLYNALASFFMTELDQALLDLTSHNLHWYMAGDLSVWWRWIRNYGTVHVLPVLSQSAWNALTGGRSIYSPAETRRRLAQVGAQVMDEDPKTSNLADDKGVLLCRTDHLVGSFIRALPFGAMPSISDLIGDHFDLFAVEERKVIGQNAWRLFGLAERVWPSVW
jgi:hypothetical protein